MASQELGKRIPYQELRRRALALNQQEIGRHPCSQGNGECCEPDIL